MLYDFEELKNCMDDDDIFYLFHQPDGIGKGAIYSVTCRNVEELRDASLLGYNWLNTFNIGKKSGANHA